MKNKIILLFLFLLASNFAFAQSTIYLCYTYPPNTGGVMDIVFNGDKVFKMSRKTKKVCRFNSEGKLIITFSGVLYNGYGNAFYQYGELQLDLSKNSVHYIKIKPKGGSSTQFELLTEEKGEKEFAKKKYAVTYDFTENNNYFASVQKKEKSQNTEEFERFLIENWRNEVFNKVSQYNNGGGKDWWYKGAVKKKRKDGMGIQKFERGSLYIGDWLEDMPNGYGIWICSNESQILNCPDAQIYVGQFVNSVRTGTGACYDRNGNLIYYGNFTDGKPIDTYPTVNVQNDYSSYKFLFYKFENGDMYLGETKNGSFDGYGVYVWANGDVQFGNFINDEPKGVAMFLSYNGLWEMGGWHGNKYSVINSSTAVAERKSLNRQAAAQAFSQAAGAVSSGLNSITNTMSQSQASSNSSSSESNTSSSGSSTSNKSTNSSNQKADCGQAWITDSRTYSNYESQLIKMRTYPEQYSNYTSDYTDIQSKMRQIRQKWESRGCQITKSQYE